MQFRPGRRLRNPVQAQGYALGGGTSGIVPGLCGIVADCRTAVTASVKRDSRDRVDGRTPVVVQDPVATQLAACVFGQACSVGAPGAFDETDSVPDFDAVGIDMEPWFMEASAPPIPADPEAHASPPASLMLV